MEVVGAFLVASGVVAQASLSLDEEDEESS